MTTNHIAFPGLGIGEFTVSEKAFSLFGKDVAWYGVIICIGLICGVLLANARRKIEGIDENDFLDILIFTVPIAIIFARIYYVLFDPVGIYDSFIDYIAIWRGGIAIYGAIIGGFFAALSVVLYKNRKRSLPCEAGSGNTGKAKISFLKLLDCLAPGVLLGQIIGRWGNFVNAEAHGTETTLPWKMGILESTGWKYYHPTFLYESLWNIIVLTLILTLIWKKKKYNGQIFFFYAAFYGLGRSLIEGLRTDSLYLGSSSVRISQLLGFLAFLVCITLYILGLMKKKRENLSQEDYKKMYTLPQEEQKTEEPVKAVEEVLPEKEPPAEANHYENLDEDEILQVVTDKENGDNYENEETDEVDNNGDNN